MTSAFVWFDNIGAERAETSAFFQAAFGWGQNDIGPMTFQTREGDDMPFAATCDAFEGISGWVPYIEVDDLAAAAQNAAAHGAVIIAEDQEGPAGTATFIRDPGGAPLALWKRGANM